MDLIETEWARGLNGSSPIEKCQNKIRHLRQYLRGWAKHQSDIYKVEKERLIQTINALDVKAESTLLNMTERNIKNVAENNLQTLMREEEMKWALNANVSTIVQG